MYIFNKDKWYEAVTKKSDDDMYDEIYNDSSSWVNRLDGDIISKPFNHGKVYTEGGVLIKKAWCDEICL